VAGPRPTSGAGAGSPPERERVKEAMIDLVIELGYEATSLELLLQRADVTPTDFERHFTDKRACFLWVFETEVDRFNGLMLAAYDQHDNWRDGLRAAAYALARFVRENPRFVLYGTIAMSGGGDLAQVQRDAVLQTYVDLIDAGRQELEDPDAVHHSAAEAVIGSIFTTLRKNAAVDRVTDPEQLVPEFMYLAVRPYLGQDAAHEELSIPPPPEQGEEGG
jgi:AcrR family transcriptional regulator